MLAVLVTVGCGRVGLELLPEDEGDPDGGSTDIGGTADGGELPDGSSTMVDAAPRDAASSNVCTAAGDAGYQPKSCGTGYCLTTSTPSRCLNGVELSCQPGTPLSSTDLTCNGVDDNCNGTIDESYVAQQCGVGYCRTTSLPSSCTGGVEKSCKPGTARSASDTTCDGVDDNCSGASDEGYVVIKTCGVGYCKAHNTPSSCTGGVETACKPSAPLSANDATADGIDDDCDGMIDEDACVPHSDTYTYRAAGYTFSPPGGCTKATVKLWGGAGASGSDDGGSWGAGVTGGQGGAGGFVTSVLTVSSSAVIQLYLGQGGQGCGAATSSNATYKGGQGGASNGQSGGAGADGSVMGGKGGNSGGDGGNGSFGGGGGGSGSKLYTSSGAGGDGGGATVLLINSARTLVAGGGGAGGGAGSTLIASGISGLSGGSGCSGAGAGSGAQGGGGGGGGICQGTTTQTGSGRTPYNAASDLAAGAALGAPSSATCGKGGDGYAIVTYAP